MQKPTPEEVNAGHRCPKCGAPMDHEGYATPGEAIRKWFEKNTGLKTAELGSLRDWITGEEGAALVAVGLDGLTDSEEIEEVKNMIREVNQRIEKRLNIE